MSTGEFMNAEHSIEMNTNHGWKKSTNKHHKPYKVYNENILKQHIDKCKEVIQFGTNLVMQTNLKILLQRNKRREFCKKMSFSSTIQPYALMGKMLWKLYVLLKTKVVHVLENQDPTKFICGDLTRRIQNSPNLVDLSHPSTIPKHCHWIQET